jgi:hypothetical protein
MFEFLRSYYERGPSDEIGAILGSLSLLPDGQSADPAMISDWNNAVQAVLAAQASGGYNAGAFQLK